MIGFGTVSQAGNYFFVFNPPFVGSAQRSASLGCTGSSPYVDPNNSATNTTYTIIEGSSTSVSSYIKTGGSSRQYFQYLAGKQNTNNSYRLLGYPTEHSFSAYTITGAWRP